MQRAWSTMGIFLLGCVVSACTVTNGVGKRDAGTNPPSQIAEAASGGESDIESRGLGDRRPIVTTPRIYPPRPNGAFACEQDQGTPLSPSSLSQLPSLTGRDLSGSVSSSLSLTNDQCRASCVSKGFLYSGTQSGSFCFCGNSHGRFGTSNACTTGCLGYLGEICGGPLANSVSFTFSPPPPPPIPDLPSNGGRCIIDNNGPGYRHTEIQVWVATGQSVPNANGPGMLIPMNWTITGNGYYDQLTPGNEDVQRWTIAGSAPVHANVTPIGSDLIFQPFESAVSITGALQGTQQKWTNGMANPPGPIGNTRQEYPYGTTVSGAAQTNQIVEMVAPVNPFPGYAQPGGVRGSVICQWNVMR
jgi:hypothetical protein